MKEVKLGKNVLIYKPELVNIYGCVIGDETVIGAFVEIQKNAIVGARCKIGPFTLVADGVTVEDEVLIGPRVLFTNTRYPRATLNGKLQREGEWKLVPTKVKRGASIGAGAIILCGISIGEKAMIGAGAVVTRSVPDFKIAVGVPARIIGDVRERKEIT